MKTQCYYSRHVVCHVVLPIGVTCGSMKTVRSIQVSAHVFTTKGTIIIGRPQFVHGFSLQSLGCVDFRWTPSVSPNIFV